MLNKAIPLFIVAVAFFLASCQSQDRDIVKSALEKDPTILTEVMLKNPDLFMDTLQKIAMDMKQKALNDRNYKEQQNLEAAFKNPLKVEEHKGDLIIGNPNAKVKIYEYSDFQCPFCLRALETVSKVLKEYDGQVAFIYRHLPIDSIHPNARLTSQYYEAVRILAGERAFEFHKTILNNQAKIRKGEKYLLEVVREMKLDTKRIKKLAYSKRVAKKVNADIESAGELGFSGTPGFVVGGIPVKGAYPYSHFKKILDRLLKADAVSSR